MDEPREATPAEAYRSVSLAAAFARHEAEGDWDAAHMVLDEVRETGLIEPVLRALAALISTYGEQACGSVERLVASLADMAIKTALSSERGDPVP